MAYTEKDEKRLVELLQKIEDGKEHEYSAPTYKDTPYLKEMQDIVKNHLDSEQPYDKDTLTEYLCLGIWQVHTKKCAECFMPKKCAKGYWNYGQSCINDIHLQRKAVTMITSRHSDFAITIKRMTAKTYLR